MSAMQVSRDRAAVTEVTPDPTSEPDATYVDFGEGMSANVIEVALPTCPSWCTMTHAAGWETSDFDGSVSLFHGRREDREVYLSQLVTRRPSGELVEGAVTISFDRVEHDMTPDQARQFAAQPVEVAARA